MKNSIVSRNNTVLIGLTITALYYSKLIENALLFSNGFAVFRSLILFFLPLSIGVVFYVLFIEQYRTHINIMPILFLSLLTLSLVYIVNWSILTSLLKIITETNPYLILFIEATLRLIGMCIAIYVHLLFFKSNYSSESRGIVFFYVSAYIFFLGLQDDTSHNILDMLFYSQGALIIGFWIFSMINQTRFSVIKKYAFGIVCIALCSAIQTALDYYFFKYESQYLIIITTTLVLIQLSFHSKSISNLFSVKHHQ